MAFKLSNLQSVSHQFSYTMRIKQVSIICTINPTSSPWYKMRLGNCLTHTIRNNKVYKRKESHKSQLTSLQRLLYTSTSSLNFNLMSLMLHKLKWNEWWYFRKLTQFSIFLPNLKSFNNLSNFYGLLKFHPSKMKATNPLLLWHSQITQMNFKYNEW